MTYQNRKRLRRGARADHSPSPVLVDTSGAAASCDGDVGNLQKDIGHTRTPFFFPKLKQIHLGLLLTKSLNDIVTLPPSALPALPPPLDSPTAPEDGALLENSASALICSPF
jgi:hypothetical protein